VLINTIKSYISHVFLFLGVSCCAAVYAAGATGPASQIAISGGDDQTELVGTTLPTPLTVLVTDSNGKPVSGAKIDWKVSGAGSLSAKSTTTNSSGIASSTLTLSVTSGNNKVIATIAATGAAVVFGETGSPGKAVTIGLSSGNNQTGVVGATLPKSLAVICKDKYGNGASHTEIVWTVVSGGASFAYDLSTTSGGIATRPLTLGTVPGVAKATAAIDGTNTSYTFTETGVSGPVYTIKIISGNDQSGNAKTTLKWPLVLEAVDSFGNAKSGEVINWSSQGDVLAAASTTTNAAGLATNTLTLGTSFGLHRIWTGIPGTSIVKHFLAVEGADSIVTVQASTDPSPNPYALKPYFLGLSYQKTMITEPYFSADNTALVTLFNKLGPGVLRIVAERPFDPIIWEPSGPGLVYGTVSKPDIARLAAFLKAVNWKVLYGVALAQNTAASAASEAAVAAQEFGSNLLGFEIGNEPDNYSNAVYGNPPEAQVPGYTFQDYISTTPVYSSSGALLPSWPAFANAIEAAVPNAPLTGPTGGFGLAEEFSASNQASRVSLLTRHYYLPGTASPTLTALFTPDPRMALQFPKLAEYAAADKIPGGYRISECNTFSNFAPGVTDSFAAALWTIDFLFSNAVYKSSGVNFESGGYGPGDFSPIFDNGTDVLGVGPDYYGLLAYSMLVKGGTMMNLQIAPSPTTFTAYAVLEADGSTDVIMNNKDPNDSVTVGLTPPNPVSRATSYLMTAPSLTATTGFQLGGSPIDPQGAWEPTSNPVWPIVDGSAVVTVPPASAQIVHIE